MDAGVCSKPIFQLPNESYFYDVFLNVQYFYRPIHTYVSIVMCVFGALCNFCNIVVLTRRQMRTPTNMILTAMACCDTVVLFSNLVYTTHYQFVAFVYCVPKHWTYSWAMFLIAHAHLSLVGHSSSVWLSVMLALIRYMTLRGRGSQRGIQIGLKHSYMAIAFVICFVTIVNGPNYFTYRITQQTLQESCGTLEVFNESSYVPAISDVALQHDCFIFRLAFWISGAVFKLLPCILLSLFVWLLLRILKQVKENRNRLLKTSQVRHEENGAGKRNGRFSLSRENRKNGSMRGRGGERTDRTTHMLLAIVFVLLATELPQGIMAVLSGMFSEEFRTKVYNPLGDLIDLLSLCGACTTFVIYCSMSSQFRKRVFFPARCAFAGDSRDRRTSDAYTKMSFLRPAEFPQADSERSVVTVMGSAASVRRTPEPSPGAQSSSPLDASSRDTIGDEKMLLLRANGVTFNGAVKEL